MNKSCTDCEKAQILVPKNEIAKILIFTTDKFSKEKTFNKFRICAFPVHLGKNQSGYRTRCCAYLN